MAFDPESLSDISDALALTFAPQLYHQMNREAATLAMLEANVGQGKSLNWDVEFTGTTGTASTVAEGTDIDDSEYGTDIPVPAILDWTEYRAPFALTEKELIAARTSIGTPEALVDLLGDRILLRGALLAANINQDILTGDGTDGSGNPNVVGFYGGACDDSGMYAGIDRGTFDEWKSTVLGNSGTPRALTLDLLYKAEEALFKACGRSPIWLLTSAGVRRKYAGLFEEVRRVVTDGSQPPRFEAGTTGPDNVGSTGYAFGGAPVRRDRQHPTGKLLMAAMDPSVKFLPPLGMDDNTVETRIRQAMGTTGNPNARMTASALPFQITPIAKTGTSVKFMLVARPQLKVPRPNAFVVIEDISEA